MYLSQFLLLHLMAGIGVAIAVYLAASGAGLHRWFQVLTAVVFWPLYLPILLTPRPVQREWPKRGEPPIPPPADELAHAIAQADSELEGALHSLDGWAEDVLVREKDRLHELRHAWTTQAERIREMDRLLVRPENENLPGTESNTLAAPQLTDRLRGSQQVIRQNLDRLRQVRRRTLEDLLGTLAWVRELVSMIHLAKFTGAPATRAEALVSQIAAAVEGLSALTWQEDELLRPVPNDYRR